MNCTIVSFLDVLYTYSNKLEANKRINCKPDGQCYSIYNCFTTKIQHQILRVSLKIYLNRPEKHNYFQILGYLVSKSPKITRFTKCYYHFNFFIEMYADFLMSEPHNLYTSNDLINIEINCIEK